MLTLGVISRNACAGTPCRATLVALDAQIASDFLKVPEGRHPRGTTLREALRGNLLLRGFSGASAGVSLRVLRGLCGALWGSAGVRG